MDTSAVERGCKVKDEVLKKKKGKGGDSAVDKNSIIYIHKMECVYLEQ